MSAWGRMARKVWAGGRQTAKWMTEQEEWGMKRESREGYNGGGKLTEVKGFFLPFGF